MAATVGAASGEMTRLSPRSCSHVTGWKDSKTATATTHGNCCTYEPLATRDHVGMVQGVEAANGEVFPGSSSPVSHLLNKSGR